MKDKDLQKIANLMKIKIWPKTKKTGKTLLEKLSSFWKTNMGRY